MTEQVSWQERLSRLANGYRGSIILLTAVKQGLFEALGHEQRTAAEVADDLDLDARAVDILLCALAALGLVRKDGEVFATEPEVRPLLLKDSPDSQVDILGHNLHLIPRWLGLDHVLRHGEPIARGERTPEQLRDFICGMENISRRSSVDVAEKIDLSAARRLLDLGGGPGTSSLTFARFNPDLHCVVFDLPGPLEIAREQITAAGLEDRVTTRSGDFLVDDLGTGYDTVYISSIIHMLGPDRTLQLLRRARAVLEPGGRLLLKDMFLEDSRTEPVAAAIFSVNMLAGTQAGKSYTRTEVLRLLESAGFGGFEVVDVARESQVIVGRAV